MILFNLIKQELLKGFRSQTFYRGLATKFLMGFMAIYFIGAFFLLGFFLGDILNEFHDTYTPLELLNGASIYILVAMLLFRFMMQTLSSVNIELYQSLPIKRKTLVNLIVLKPLVLIGNYAILVVVLPFAFRSVVAWHSMGVAWQFVLNTIFLICFNTLITSYLKRRFGFNLKVVIAILVFGALFAALEYFNLFSFFNLSMKLFGFLVFNPFGLLVSVALVVLAYLLNINFFSKNYYAEKINEKLSKGENKITSGFGFLEKYGTIGELIRFEIRLILRHKRTKSLVYLSVFFMFYGLLFYTNDMYKDSMGMIIFIGLILTGMATMMYGQFAMSWESSFFDAILTKNIPLRNFVKSYYVFLISLIVVSFILTSPYFYFGKKIILLHVAMMLYNIGVTVFVLMFASTFNTKRVDLNAKSAFNYQGTSYKGFLMLIPLMAFPVVLSAVLMLFMSFEKTMLVFMVLGLIGIVSLPYQINIVTKQLQARKYKMAAGFREKE